MMKKGMIIICVLMVLISACSVNKKEHRVLKYGDSAYSAIERAVKEIKLSNRLSSVINDGDVVTISSIESVHSEDGHVNALVEDIFIHDLLSAGYAVMERDHNVVYKNLIDSGKLNKSDVSIKDNESIGFSYMIEKADGFEVLPANKSINYRIKEIGVAYRPDDSPDSKSKTIREARVIMNVRVESPSTNRILYCDTLDGSVFDTFNTKEAKGLESLGYKFTPSGYQLYKSCDEMQTSHEYVSVRKNKLRIAGYSVAGALGAILFIAILTSD
jgi:hypothetical protein